MFDLGLRTIAEETKGKVISEGAEKPCQIILEHW